MDGVADESGISASAVQTFHTATGNSWGLIGEVAVFNNFWGTADNILYASAGVVYDTGPWTAVLSGTWRPRDLADGREYNDYSVQTSIEYDLGESYSVALAHELNRDENLKNGGWAFGSQRQLV